MSSTAFKYKWAAKGDLNAFFALMLDNMMNLVILTGILAGFGYPTEYVFKLMIPGTALGVFIGDLVYTYLAFKLAKERGDSNVCAMPLGLDTPSTIGISLIVLGPVWLETKDPILTWQVGMATTVCMGLIKIIFSFLGEHIRRIVPKAGLIGSLAGVGLALLGFLPLMHIFAAPVVGMIAFGLILYTLVASKRLPFGIPGAFAAVIIGSVLWHVLGRYDLLGTVYHAPQFNFFLGYPHPTLQFLNGFTKALNYLPVAIPFGILTIVGGINVTESAMLAGDTYKTRTILLTEAFATLIAGICGGVSQSTPYIGHPAFKKMGARAAYTLATGIFIGLGGCLGYVQSIVDLIPAASVAPILVFVGLEIIDQGFMDCPRNHASAVGIALLPSVGELIRIITTGQLHIDEAVISTLPAVFQAEAFQTFKLINAIGHGFIITAMLWGAAVAHLIDGKIKNAGIYFLICAFFTSFGLIHSTLPSGGLYVPCCYPDYTSAYFTIGYLCMAAIMFICIRANNNDQLSKTATA